MKWFKKIVNTMKKVTQKTLKVYICTEDDDLYKNEKER